MLIDITRLLGLFFEGKLPTGLSRVGLSYIGRFHSQARAVVRYAGRWMELNGADSRRAFDALQVTDFSAAAGLRTCIAGAYVFGWTAGNSRIFINTDYTGLDLPSYARVVRRRGLKPLFFLHDLLPIAHPEYFRPGEEARHRLRLQAVADLGQGLIVNSGVTLAALQDHAIGHQERQALHLPRGERGP